MYFMGHGELPARQHWPIGRRLVRKMPTTVPESSLRQYGCREPATDSGGVE